MSSDAKKIIDIYRQHARAWIALRGKRLPEVAWLERFEALLPAAGSVLDIGCGSGVPVGSYLLRQGFSVHGIDSSPELIAHARATVADGRWNVADMRDLALGQQFDGVIAWNSFFHLTPDDQRAMFPIFGRHCSAEGALMFTSGTSLGESIGTFEGTPLYHASLDAAEYRTLLSANGFQVVAHISEDPDCGGQTIWLARRSGGV